MLRVSAAQSYNLIRFYFFSFLFNLWILLITDITQNFYNFLIAYRKSLPSSSITRLSLIRNRFKIQRFVSCSFPNVSRRFHRESMKFIERSWKHSREMKWAVNSFYRFQFWRNVIGTGKKNMNRVASCSAHSWFLPRFSMKEIMLECSESYDWK